VKIQKCVANFLQALANIVCHLDGKGRLGLRLSQCWTQSEIEWVLWLPCFNVIPFNLLTEIQYHG
jgi:hypothetical protein